MQRLILSLTLVSAVSLSAAGNHSHVFSRAADAADSVRETVANVGSGSAGVKTTSSDQDGIFTRAATTCSNACGTCKDFFVDNARLFAHTGVAAITLPSVAYLAQYMYDYWYDQLPQEPTAQERVQLYAAACGAACGAYYTAYQFDVAPHQLAIGGYNYLSDAAVNGYHSLFASEATS